MDRNRDDAESYHYNQNGEKNNKRNTPGFYFWTCRRCKTKNSKTTITCYNCATRKYKPYNRQHKDCKAYGILFEVKDPADPKNILLACAKYRTACSPSVCMHERTPCLNECAYHPVYGFVPEADCPVHDKGMTLGQELLRTQKDTPPEFIKTVDKRFWDLA